ncbi:MAG: HD domain-containing protein [Solirubrobacterales bacterium]|nr:HD domain-containing protein [Solirubrobacterales bacterium]
MSVKDLSDGERFGGVLAVRSMASREAKNGKPYIRAELGDAGGSVIAMIWDATDELERLYAPGAALQVEGTIEEDERWGRQIRIQAVSEAQVDDYDPAELFESSSIPATKMEAQLRSLVASVEQPQLSELLDNLLGEQSSLWPIYRDAPAAKRFHQAYRHGLLEHCLTVAQSVSDVANNFPGINRDLALTGALLHDIGKLEAYTDDPIAIDFTDDGRLQGEIPLGYYRVRSAIEQIDDFPPDLARGLLHIILSHHGKLEHGSPVVPMTREATLVHMIDHLGGQLGSFDRLERSLTDGSAWSQYDMAIGGGAWFAASGES